MQEKKHDSSPRAQCFETIAKHPASFVLDRPHTERELQLQLGAAAFSFATCLPAALPGAPPGAEFSRH